MKITGISKNNELCNPKLLHINRLPRRSTVIPAEKSDIYYRNKYESERILSLNGEYKFLYRNSDTAPDFYESLYDDSSWDTIDVPSMWQFRGYGKCRYPNTEYSIPFNPPYVCCENPVGYYRKRFEIKKNFAKTFIHFGGVDNAFYAYINGRFVGFSKGSRNFAEFDVSDFLTEGENILAVKVFTYSDATYLENQDMLLASGIFRDVYLINMHEDYVWDYRATGDASGFSVEVASEGNAEIETEIDGIVKHGKNTRFDIENPRLWNAEQPNLYKLTIRLKKDGKIIETHSKKIGIISTELKHGNFLVNGSPIYIKGVNRHESFGTNGRAIPEWLIEKELRMIKDNNLNAIRCSHYTNNPVFYELCSEIGIYVMDEADIESHGCEVTGDQGYLAKRPEWFDAFRDRVTAMLEQNKNEPCVFMHSMGNENGKGENIEKCLEISNAFDPSVVSVGGMQETSDDLENDSGKNEYIRRTGYINEETLRKYMGKFSCVMMTEYAHAMGNSPGFLENYYDIMYNSDNYFGGFVWEFKNHGFVCGDDVLYGGDFGENREIHWKNFCLDGYIMTDGTPKYTWYELGNVSQPVYIKKNAEGIVFKNTYDFKTLDCIEMIWSICENYHVIKSGAEMLPPILPHCEKRMNFDLNYNRKENSRYFLNMEFFEGGKRLGVRQIELTEKTVKSPFCPPIGNICVKTGDGLKIEGGGFAVEFENGLIKSYVRNGKALCGSMKFNFFRAPTDNDGILDLPTRSWSGRNTLIWKEKFIDTLKFFAYETECEEEDDCVIVKSRGKILPNAKYLGFDAKTEYRIFADGTILFDTKCVPFGKLPERMPRMGVVFEIPDNFDEITWYGRGKNENYADIKCNAPMGLYNARIKDMYTVFDMPQESGNRENTVFARLGEGLAVIGCDEFSFSYHDVSLENLTNAMHRSELEKSESNYFYIDYKMRGIGSHSCGPEVEDKYELYPHAFEFAFVLSGGLGNEDALELSKTDFGAKTRALSGKFDPEKDSGVINLL